MVKKFEKEGEKMKIGIIGTGSMGSILIESFIESAAVTPSQLIITNRTIEKALAFTEDYHSIQVAEDAKSVVTESDIIFLCVKPLQFHPLLLELNDVLKKEQIIVSITSPLQVDQLESIVPCKVARIIPSITNRALAGSSLVTFGDSCDDHDRDILTRLMSAISSPIEIKPNITRVASDLASCGPAFISFLIQAFIDAAVRQTEITKEEATEIATEMMVGYGELLKKKIFTLPSLQDRVTVPGGVTGEGLKVLKEEIGNMFDQLFQSTHAKYDEDIAKINDQYSLY